MKLKTWFVLYDLYYRYHIQTHSSGSRAQKQRVGAFWITTIGYQEMCSLFMHLHFSCKINLKIHKQDIGCWLASNSLFLSADKQIAILQQPLARAHFSSFSTIEQCKRIACLVLVNLLRSTIDLEISKIYISRFKIPLLLVF